eukprot:6470094-Amphidinium_carterae.1
MGYVGIIIVSLDKLNLNLGFTTLMGLGWAKLACSRLKLGSVFGGMRYTAPNIAGAFTSGPDETQLRTDDVCLMILVTPDDCIGISSVWYRQLRPHLQRSRAARSSWMGAALSTLPARGFLSSLVCVCVCVCCSLLALSAEDVRGSEG